ncbi:MAG: glycosyltransferase family 4 protein [Halieaceae bacterium]|nr:glycosyltransferase family 4 protein [Halieaceae bacterium]
MKLLYVTPKPFLPDSRGGAQLSTITLLQELRKRGWDVQVVALRKQPISVLIRAFLLRLFLFKRESRVTPTVETEIVVDRVWGFSAMGFLGRHLDLRYLKPTFKRRIEEIAPDILLGDFSASDSLFKFALALGITCIKTVRSLPVLDHPSIVPLDLHVIGNSPYSSRVAGATFNREVYYVQPYIDRSRYKVQRKSCTYITFINPTEQKGLPVAVEIARLMPEHRFQFVMGKWSGCSEKKVQIQVSEARSLDNVDIVSHIHDMREVYSGTRLLIVPSQFVETFGRVIVEAQLNGIPVVGAHVGGIRETLGKGGILVENRSSPLAYVNAIREILDNEEQFSTLALENVEQDEFILEKQIEKFQALATGFLQADRSSRDTRPVGTPPAQP